MTKIKYCIAAALMAASFNSCSDMLNSESDRYVYNPELDQKVDSMFYINGILKGVQQAIDQTVLVNELRGDLLTTTSYASTDLKRLASFDYSEGNKYDSAYVYYRIINNCNYYVAHRDTTLLTGSSQVAMKEYAEAKAIRAWAYMQLARTYGSVPFYTSPLTNISDVDQAAGLERKNMNQICAELAPDLEQYVTLPVPSSSTTYDAGTSDHNESKTVTVSQLMFPVRLVLADLYLETGQYPKAAEHYFQYLKANKLVCGNYIASLSKYPNYKELSSALREGDKSAYNVVSTWNSIFQNNLETQTYVAMATNKLRGEITDLPAFFGYNYYTSSDGETYNEESSLQPSDAYLNLTDNQEYYYLVTSGKKGNADYKCSAYSQTIGDMRYHSSYDKYKFSSQPETSKIINKYNKGNIQIYRTAGIYLKLAEAINRMGHPDVAFAVLKDGLNVTLENDTTYMTQEGLQFLKTTIPFLTPENRVIFNDEVEYDGYSTGNQPIHMRGAGYTAGNMSLYSYRTEVDKKLALLRDKGYSIPATATKKDTLQAEIDAVEDLLCDEMALELAFEGTRFGDLCRIARHKNQSNPYGVSNYGNRWLRDKLDFKNASPDLSNEVNWYLPFK